MGADAGEGTWLVSTTRGHPEIWCAVGRLVRIDGSGTGSCEPRHSIHFDDSVAGIELGGVVGVHWRFRGAGPWNQHEVDYQRQA